MLDEIMYRDGVKESELIAANYRLRYRIQELESENRVLGSPGE